MISFLVFVSAIRSYVTIKAAMPNTDMSDMAQRIYLPAIVSFLMLLHLSINTYFLIRYRKQIFLPKYRTNT